MVRIPVLEAFCLRTKDITSHAVSSAYKYAMLLLSVQCIVKAKFKVSKILVKGPDLDLKLNVLQEHLTCEGWGATGPVEPWGKGIPGIRESSGKGSKAGTDRCWLGYDPGS